MKKRIDFLGQSVLLSFLVLTLHGQEIKRDTSLFNEHQVIFEKMSFIPDALPVKIIRNIEKDTSVFNILCDPYWVGCMVSNKEYKVYLKSIKNDFTKEKYRDALPNNKVFSKKIKDLNISYKKYFTKSKYKDYPVLGLNWEQANKFCIWKTLQVNKELDNAGLPRENSYRLPRQAEIELAKRYGNINMPMAYKIDSTNIDKGLIDFYSKVNEWTGDFFIDSLYLKNYSVKDTSDHALIYLKEVSSHTPFFKQIHSWDLNLGFRYVQTYRIVPISD